MDRCVARLQELQYTVSGGTKVISGVSLSPGSSRGYLRASLRCKQKLQGLKAQPLENLLLASFQQRQELYKFSISFDHLPNKPRASFSPAKQKKIKEACNFVCSPPLQISLETGFKGHIFHFLDVQSLDSTHHRTKPLSELGFLNRKGEINTIEVYAEGACKREAQVKVYEVRTTHLSGQCRDV